MLPTPSTSHVSYDLVYEPAEDSYLFLDTLSSPAETAWLRSRFSLPSPRSSPLPLPVSGQQTPTPTPLPKSTPTSSLSPTPLIVEIGPGSGVVIAFLVANAKTIFGRDVLSLAVDVNPYACRGTRTTVEKALAEKGAERRVAGEKERGGKAVALSENSGGDGAENDQGVSHYKYERNEGASIYLSSVNGDLATPLRPGEVDVLVFNPPYVPTDSVPAAPTTTKEPEPNPNPTFEEQSALLALSYAGGPDGMQVTNRLLAQIPEVLSPRGVAYVLFCRGNKPDEVKRWIPGKAEQWQWHWRAETVGTSGKTAGWEKLEIVRIWREWERERCE
ncbi:hypothetical protein Z517_08483 [Fonsecaea pedrosoi CBS 271.37]|uniref:Unplaced genomic scaffold supercont1.5, whole genome shotgun sequence n=1 Tax=Fonsecaea pedrosoi CBS 271.37 TaxID=1442368 RepID=A0A0D2GJB6_9EURO|nr:uncharacterized protein Z517_08483 [Fonsecaea pedrosoi CBS 271.37]KIW78645.1 hypothetical protein Z517_08483 [Fonsecaea pedrosoi CBS 271.37]